MIPVISGVNRWWVPHAAVAASTGAVLVLTIFSLMHGISTVFMHLYYLPIVLIGYFYRRRGVPLILAISLAYFLLVGWFEWPSLAEIGGAALRAGMFVLIGSIVAYLSDRLAGKSADLVSLVGNVQDIMYRADAGGNLVMASPSWAALFGYSSVEECLGKNLARDFYMNPGDREAFLRELAKEGRITGFVVTLKRRDGSPVTVSTSSHYWYNADGTIAGVEGVFRDVTRQQQLEQELRESEARYREFFITSRDCVFITSPGGRWIDFNDSALELFGYDRREDLASVPIGSLYAHEEDRERIVRRIISEGYVRDYPAQLKRRDGSLVDALITTVAVRNADGSVRHLTGTVRDITAQNQVLVALRESEEKFRQFFNNVNDAVYVHRIHPDGRPGRIIEANDVMCLRLGYTRDELLAMEMPDLVPVKSRTKMPDIAAEMARVGDATFETFHRAKDGEEIPVEVSTHLFIQNGERLALASARDITERRKAEAALRSGEQRFRNLFENMQEGLAYCRMLYDANGDPADFIYLAINSAFDHIIGAGTVIGKPVTEVFPGIRDAFPQLFEIYGRVARTGVPESFDLDFSPAGKWLHISVYSPAKEHFTAIFSDISERKHAEAALRESEEKFRNIFDSISDAVHIHEIDEGGLPGRFVAVNDAACTMLGYARNELLKMGPLDFVTAFHSRPLDEIGNDLRTKGLAVFETEHIRKDSSIVPVEISAHVSSIGGKQVVVSVVRDITERKRNEAALRESEERFRRIFEMNNAVMLLIEPVTGLILDANPSAVTFYGYPRDQIRTMHIEDINRLPPAEVAQMRNEIAGKIRQSFVAPHRLADGSMRTVEVYSSPVQVGSSSYLFSIIHDITEKKKAEEALRESHHLLEAVLNNITVRVFWKDRNLVFLGCNTPFARDAGYEKPEEIIGKNDYAMGWREQAELYRADDRAVLETGRDKILYEEPQTTPTGQKSYLLTSKVSLRGAGGEIIGILGTYLDITARKRAEEALLDSERRLFDIINFLPDPTFVIDRDGRVIAWNLAIQALTDIPQDEILGKGNYEYAYQLFGERRPLLIDLVIHADPDVFKDHYRNIQRSGTILSGQFHVPSLRGKPADLWILATPLFNSSGEITGAIESIRDITEIKKIETALRDLNLTLEQRVRERTQQLDEAQRYNRSLIEADLDPLILISPEGIIRDVNSAAERMTGTKRNELIGTHFSAYILEKEDVRNGFAAVIASGRSLGNRYTVLRSDGTGTPVSSSAALLRDNNGAPADVFVSLHDITGIIRNEELISAQLSEKEVLLREIHHRVKNNLQIVISLINLETRTIQDPVVLGALRDTQNRIRAIAIVHERLHTSKELGTIDFGIYLRFLGTSLFSFYQKNAQDIHFEIDAENVILDIDTASPLGLICNELISNVLKYAFPDGRKGECRITARREERTLVLSIRDNGVGIPTDLDWQNSPTLGLRLVHILVGQLKGTITLDRTGGTQFTITLPLPEHVVGIHRVGSV